ncbi:adult-specific cuticular protein ACP-20-like [Anoplophora glabripennis]|uniref:adult-specific cuticular protein ACP-20-like n=1 Tax=Anoplophora glabripennis TaxID=217634 RepID=UPI0008745985|nr:adult-specific cuticular protein ACP-20-like [Anoplophora glabripennis]
MAVCAFGGHHHDNAHYKFEYGVDDPHTHDKKEQHEHRDGKHVTGGYSLKEPDGTHRVVKYVSGPHKGFEAVVERRGHAKHPAVYGKHKGHGEGGTSWVGVTHWQNQGDEEQGHGHGHGHGH